MLVGIEPGGGDIGVCQQVIFRVEVERIDLGRRTGRRQGQASLAAAVFEVMHERVDPGRRHVGRVDQVILRVEAG